MTAEDMLKHFVPGYPPSLDVGVGWLPLLSDLHDELSGLDPEYRLHQVKEKFGGLRVYYDIKAGVVAEARSAVERAEGRAWQTCERCGRPGSIREITGWRRVACDEHA